MDLPHPGAVPLSGLNCAETLWQYSQEPSATKSVKNRSENKAKGNITIKTELQGRFH